MDDTTVESRPRRGGTSAAPPQLRQPVEVTIQADAPQARREAGEGQGSGSPSYRWERAFLARMLRSLGDPPIGLLLWDGQRIQGGGPAVRQWVVVGDRLALWRLASDPLYQFPELYAEGRVTVEGNLVELLTEVTRLGRREPGKAAGLRAAGTAWLRQLTHSGRNTLHGSKQNIHHHYDIGNDFYRLWLDEQLFYTCAYYERPEMTVEQAQTAKCDHVCRKLQLRPGQRVVEAGCGWGGLAMHMARHYGVTVRAYNISKEQVAYARQRAEREGLGDRVQFIEDDWRAIEGRYDVFVSVGMLEHVGLNNYRQLGRVIRDGLKVGGRGLIHSIGRNYPQRLDRWIERHIFPGACPPAISQMMDIFEPHDLSVLDVENIRLHYAWTLRHWLERFERSAERVRQMFDERFVRMWRMYLSGSIAAFEGGSLQLFQVVFAHGQDNTIPATRRHIYDVSGSDS